MIPVLENSNNCTLVREVTTNLLKKIPIKYNIEVFNGPFFNQFTFICSIKNISMQPIKNLLFDLSVDKLRVLHISDNLLLQNETLLLKQIEIFNSRNVSVSWMIFEIFDSFNPINYDFIINLSAKNFKKVKIGRIYSIFKNPSLAFNFYYMENMIKIVPYNPNVYVVECNDMNIQGDEITTRNPIFRKDEDNSYTLLENQVFYLDDVNNQEYIFSYKDEEPIITIKSRCPNSSLLAISSYSEVDDAISSCSMKKISDKEWELEMITNNRIFNGSIAICSQDYTSFNTNLDDEFKRINKYYLYIPLPFSDSFQKTIKFDKTLSELNVFYFASNIKNTKKYSFK